MPQVLPSSRGLTPGSHRETPEWRQSGLVIVPALVKACDREAQVGRLFPNDHTHTNLQGADMNAESVIAGLKALLDCRLCPYLSEKK